jgi:hypothetical protein
MSTHLRPWTPEIDRFLLESYAEIRRVRTSAQTTETYVSWNEGYFRGMIETAALLAGVTSDEVLERLHGDASTAAGAGR